MPRKYDKKTKANFRAGRRNSRRASMRINMVSPGLSMFNDEFDPAIDDTMLMLKAKGIDRERERYTEALSEVRDKISRIVDDYDAMLDESSHVYRDYIDELQDEVSVMPGSKLKHNILRILADYKFVCADREELLHALQDSMNAQKKSLGEAPTYFDDEDEFDFYTSDTCLRNYSKTLKWFSEKFKDMDAKVCMLKKRELASKGDKKRMKKQKEKAKLAAAETVERLEAANSKERLETWKFAAEEIVDLLNTVRQEGEGGKDILAGELQKIMNIMNKQNEEIEKKTGMLQKEKEATLRMKQNRDKLQIQIGTLEGRLMSKQNEVTSCKQYIQDIVKKMKASPGEIKFSLDDMDDDTQDELPTVMRRRFTLTQSSLEEDFAEMKLKDAQKKATELMEENSKLQGEIAKLGEAIVQKDKELIELKTMFSAGEGIACPKCLRLTDTPGSEEDQQAAENAKLGILEQKLQESESKLEATVVELARVRINLASSGIILPDMVTMGSQTPEVDEDETESEEEQDQFLSSNSSLEEERNVSVANTCLPELVTTKPSPLAEEGLDEAGASRPQTIQRSSKKQKRKKQTKKDRSRKQTAHSSAHPDTDGKSDSEMGDGDTKDVDDEFIESTMSPTMNVKMKNKAVQTVHGRVNSAFRRSPLNAQRSIAGSRAMDRMDDLKEEMASLVGGKMESETSWRTRLHKLCNNIEEALTETETEDQLEQILSATAVEGKTDVVEDTYDDFRSTEEQFAQNASRKRKSIFMRLVENDKRKTISRELTPTHDSHGRRIRQRSICTPKKIQNIQEEPDKSTSNAHLPAVPSQHRPKSSKHASIDTPEQTKSATSKQSRPKIAETPKSEGQVSEPGKPTGILKHTPLKHLESHPPSHPKDDMKGKVRKQSLTFSGDEEATAPYSKPFRVRRKSVFGHTDVLEKLASATCLDNAGLSGENKYVDESDRYHDGLQEEFMRAVSRGRSSDDSVRDPTMPERAFDAQHLKYRRMSRGRFRPSMHPFIGLSDEDRASLTNMYNTKHNAASRLGKKMLDIGDEESEIEVGTLMNNFRRDSLRKAFLSLGLMHLRGESDDVRADERLTMEDQVNIVAEMAMEVLKATCDVFAKSRRKSQSIPNQEMHIKANEEEELRESRESESEREVLMFPPVNTPESRVLFEDEQIKDSPDDHEENKEVSLPELPKRAATSEAETTSLVVNTKKPSLMKRSRQGSEQEQKEMFARFAAKRRSLNRSNHPFRNFNARKTVMERILGNRISVFGNMLGNEQDRFSAVRSHRTSLSRRALIDSGDKFTLTAQAIKLPTQTSAVPQLSQQMTKLPPQGMSKSSSVGAHAHFASGRLKNGPAIAKAKSEQTHNRLFIGAQGQEQSRSPAGRLRHAGLRKRL